MNKKIKLISTLTAAGIIAATGFAGNANASTRSLGKYSSLNDLKNVVPYILGQDEKITYKDLTDEFGDVKVSKPVDNETVIGTGDTFTVNNKTYTVIIYGDVTGDGYVDSEDAKAVANYSADLGTAFNAYQLEAANVAETDSKDVDSADAKRIVDYKVGTYENTRDTKPTGEKEQDVKTNYEYKITVSEDNIINHDEKAADKVKLGVEANQTSDKDRKLNLKVKNEKGEYVSSFDKFVVIAKNKIKVDENDDKGSYIASSQFKDLANGKYVIEAYNDGDDKTVVASTNFEVADYTPTIGKINAKRTDTKTVALSLEGIAPDTKVSKIDYKVGDTTKSIENVNNKLTDSKLDIEFPEDTTTINLTAYDKYGNKYSTTTTALPYGTGKAEVVKSIKEPDLAKNETEFTIEGLASSNEIYLYKDGEVVTHEETDSSTGNKNTVYTLTADANGKVNVANYINKAGKYKISVINKDASKTNSDEVTSKEIEVKNLNAIEGLNVKIEEGVAKISFTDSNEAKTELATKYEINLNKINFDKDGNETDPTTTAVTIADVSKMPYVTTTLDANTLYTVSVVAKADTNTRKDYVDSEKVDSSRVFYVASGTVGDANDATKTDTSIKFEFNKPTTLNFGNKEVTYKAEVAEYTTGSDKVEHVNDSTIVRKDINLVKEDDNKTYFTVNGLTPNTRYAVRLVATVDGVEGTSDWKKINDTTHDLRTYNTPIAIDNLKVVGKDEDAKAGTIFATTSKAIVNGVTVKDGTADLNYSASYLNKVALANNLKANDVVTIKDNAITITVNSDGNEVSKNIEIGAEFKDYDVTLKASGTEVDRNVTVSGDVKSISIDSGFVATIVSTTKPVTVKNGAEVNGNVDYILVKGATAKINGIQVSSDNADVKVKATAHKDLEVSTEKGLTTNLTFVNLNDERNGKAGENATINFVGDSKKGAQLIGTVKITSEGGSVTVVADNTNVSDTNLEVTTTNNADVDVTKATDTKSSNVSATYTADKDDVVLNVTPNADVAKILSDAKITTFELKDGKYDANVTEEQKAILDRYVSALGTGITDAKLDANGLTVTVKANKTVTLTGVTKVAKATAKN